MKKHLLLTSILFLAFHFINAQYQSIFGNTQTSWNIKHEQLFGNYTDSLTVSTDTTINNEFWKKLDYYSYFNSTPALMPQNVFLKEDLTFGKVWYFSSLDTVQRLIVDLSLTLNDTFTVANLGGIITVDSVYTQNSRKHIRFNAFINSQQTEKFLMIEGIGTNLGISYKETQFPSLNPYLLCQYKDFIINYQNNHPIYSGICNTITSIEELFNESTFIMFPNPTSGKFIISHTSTGSASKGGIVEIYDINGKLVYSQVLPPWSTLQNMSLPNLSEGIYALKITSDGICVVKKVILKE